MVDVHALSAFLLLASLPALTYGAYPFFRQALHALRARTLHPDLLISLALISGISLSLWNMWILKSVETYLDALSIVVFLLLTSRIIVRYAFVQIFDRSSWKQSWTVKRVLNSTNIQFIPLASLKVGDVLRLNAGDLVPARATLIDFQAEFDTSVLTGEACPRTFRTNEALEEGYRNLAAEVDIHIVDTPQFQKWDHWLEQEPTSPHARDQIFSGIILALALGLGIYRQSYELALSLLIVSCPCAWLLARPLALLRFRSHWFERGVILFRLPSLLRWAETRRIAFDKTGTLAQGFPEVTACEVRSPSTFDRFKYHFAGMAGKSHHPLSRGLSRHLGSTARIDTLEAYEEIPGVGLSAQAGSHHLEIRRASTPQSQMTTSLLIASNEIACLSFEDPIRPHTKEVLHDLKEQGFHLEILSGDHQESLARFIREHRLEKVIDRASGNLLPEHKATRVDKDTLFVGDGLNDPPAMRQAGASLGLVGSAESNFEKADAYLLQRDLRLIPELLFSTRRLRRSIAILEWYAYSYNLLAILLVWFGILGPIVCAILMPLSSISVALLAFSLQRPRSRKMSRLLESGWGVLSKLPARMSREGELLPSLRSHVTRVLSRLSS